jgi:NADPH:quinone reductase
VKAIRVHACGGPEAMVLEDLPLPSPGPARVVVEVKAAGVNLFDTQLRSGLYKRDLPLTLGLEGAGIVAAVGPEVTDIAVGDRVAFIFAAGTYATHTLAPAERVVPLPDGVGFEDAAAMIFQGLTAHYLATSTFPLAPGSSCLVHSAAGGCGILLCQIAKIRGAHVIGAVSSPKKAEIARDAGADHVIVYAQEDFAAAVKRVTDGRGVDVVYDAVGLDTYIRSMDSLRPRGMLALYGEASGLVPPIDPRELLFRNRCSSLGPASTIILPTGASCARAPTNCSPGPPMAY